MYERKRIQKLEAEKEEEKVKGEFGGEATNESQEKENESMRHDSCGEENGKKGNTKGPKKGECTSGNNMATSENLHHNKGEINEKVLSKSEETPGNLQKQGEGNNKMLSKSEATSDDLDELNKSLARLAESVVEKKKAEDLNDQQSGDQESQENVDQWLDVISSKVEDESEKVGEVETNVQNKEVDDKAEENKEDVAEKEKVDELEKDAAAEKFGGSERDSRKLSIESLNGKEGKDDRDGKDDVFVYLCPFPNCDFSTDFEVTEL